MQREIIGVGEVIHLRYGTKTSKNQDTKVSGMGSKNIMRGTAGVTVRDATLTPWFPGLCVLSVVLNIKYLMMVWGVCHIPKDSSPTTPKLVPPGKINLSCCPSQLPWWSWNAVSVRLCMGLTHCFRKQRLNVFFPINWQSTSYKTFWGRGGRTISVEMVRIWALCSSNLLLSTDNSTFQEQR